MSILKQSLDKTYNPRYELTSRLKEIEKNYIHLLYYIDNNYYKYNTDPLTENVLKKFPIPKKLIIKKEKIIINKEINTLSDLIDILIELHPIVSNAEYNINMDRIQKIKEPLIELNNLIGLHDLKNDILDQILFYVQDFHKTSGMDYMHTVLYGSPGTGKTEVAKIIGKIFSQLGIVKKKYIQKSGSF